MKRGFHTLSDLPQTLPIFPLTGVVLLPHSALPLNVFEPRYLALVDDALSGNRLIGMIQPTESEDDGAEAHACPRWAAPAAIVSYRETEDNRYLITLAGVCRFQVKEEIPVLSPYRQVACDFAPFASDLAQSETDDFPRERLLAALKDYLSRRDMKADWKSVMTAPPESLVNALAMMCPFEPAEKQALLEAPSWIERVATLVTLLEISTAPGPGTLN